MIFSFLLWFALSRRRISYPRRAGVKREAVGPLHLSCLILQIEKKRKAKNKPGSFSKYPRKVPFYA
jgi:hypothetical protein